jgi:hypothetical protein
LRGSAGRLTALDQAWPDFDSARPNHPLVSFRS